MFDTFTPAMYEAMRGIAAGHVCAKDIGPTAGASLNALCDRGFLIAERHASKTYYAPTEMGVGAIAVLTSPICPKPSEGPVAHIQSVVAWHYGIPIREMTSARRSREVARPRQVAMYLTRERTPFSYPHIGRLFGNRDHTTVLHAVRTIEALRKGNRALAQDIDTLLEKLAA
jgi:hypothetical protein